MNFKRLSKMICFAFVVILSQELYGQSLETNLSEQELALLLVKAKKGQICCKQYELLQVRNVAMYDSVVQLHDSVKFTKNLLVKQTNQANEFYLKYKQQMDISNYWKLRFFAIAGLSLVITCLFTLRKFGIIRFF